MNKSVTALASAAVLFGLAQGAAAQEQDAEADLLADEETSLVEQCAGLGTMEGYRNCYMGAAAKGMAINMTMTVMSMMEEELGSDLLMNMAPLMNEESCMEATTYSVAVMEGLQDFLMMDPSSAEYKQMASEAPGEDRLGALSGFFTYTAQCTEMGADIMGNYGHEGLDVIADKSRELAQEMISVAETLPPPSSSM